MFLITSTTVRPLDNFISLLSGVVIESDHSWKSLCPMHDDHSPSLAITEATDGKVLVYCFVCADKNIGPKICNKFGISIRALFPDWGLPAGGRGDGKKRRKIEGKKVAEYEYRDIEGVVIYKAMRYETASGGKTFAQARPNGRGGWIMNMRGVRRIPYRLPELVAADKSQVVFCVEGEGKVEALRTWGQIATCNVGGAGKWNNEFATYFRGRRVIILPDNDPPDDQTGRKPGLDHAVKVFANLKPVAKSVRILELPDLPEKGDIVDWQAGGHTLAELLDLVARAESSGEETLDAGATVAQLDPLSIQLISGRTDRAAGQRLIVAVGNNLRYCRTMRKWFYWTGKRWVIDQKCVVERYAKKCTESLWESIGAMGQDVSAELKETMKKWCKYADSYAGMMNCIKIAASEPELQISTDTFDSNPWLLNCKNGTIDLKTGELHEHRRDDLQTKLSPVNFDLDAECPVWNRFIMSVFNGNTEVVDYVQRLCGYWATGIIREQMMPILWGGGSNGKTTFLAAILDVLGADYTMKATSDFLMTKRGDAHPTEKADLHGKRIVFCSETEEGRRLSESLVKELTGTEHIRARRMREDFWEFKPTHKIALFTNHKPVVTGGDHGIWRRIRLVEFGVQFWDSQKGETGPPELKQDPELPNRLLCEWPGILRWIVAGCQAWQQDGEQVPKIIQAQTSDYKSSQDNISQWLSECCDLNPQASERASGLYESFRQWSELAGEYVISQKRFSASLGDRGFHKSLSSGVWYHGIELLPEGYFE